MPRRDDSHAVIYVRRPREVVNEFPRRAATYRDYIDQSYVSDRYVERPRRTRNDSTRETVFVSDAPDDYGPDVYYLPSRGPRDAYQSARPTQDYSDRISRGARFAPALEVRQRRRRSSDDYAQRRPESPDEYDQDRGDRGRREDRRASPARRLRSAMRGGRNQSPDAQHRARARSVSFREREASKHDVGNQKHEKPGYEARAVGQYLRHDDDDDLASGTYAIRRRARRYS